jgi:putative MATE family efflux protein
MDIIFFGALFFTMIAIMSAVLQAAGNTTAYRNFLIGGFFLNIILDPWLLYGGLGLPAFGFRGVAIATVVIQILGTIYLWIEAKKRGLVGRQTWSEMKPDFHYYIEILKQAGPASLNMVTIGIGIFVITYFINQFGQSAVAAYGIATRVEQIILLPTIGLTIACLSIIGQNNGAKKFGRVRETLMACLKYGITIMAFGGALIFIFSRLIMSFFTDNAEVIAIGAHYLKIASGITIAYAILFVTVSALQGMKKPMYAVWIGLFRQIVAPIAIFSLAINYFNFGIDGIWWGIFAITWFAAIVTLFYAKHVLKEYEV